MVDREAIKKNVASRKLVEELIAYAEASMSEVNQERFWRGLAEAAAGRGGLVLVEDGPLSRPMTDQEARRFSCLEMPTGKHSGQSIGSLSIDYLDHIVNNEFSRDLRRYVQSSFFRTGGKKQGGVSHVSVDEENG